MNKYRSTYRQKILELFDEGERYGVARDELVINLINFLSESGAKEFWEQYYDEDEDYDDQPRWATKLVPGTPRF
jgi:predicted NAD/FAD-dependent oxidoreductase